MRARSSAPGWSLLPPVELTISPSWSCHLAPTASYIAKTLVASSSRNTVLLASRHPDGLHKKLAHLGNQVLPPKAGVDVSKRETLDELVNGASTVINLVGLVHALVPSLIWRAYGPRSAIDGWDGELTC